MGRTVLPTKQSLKEVPAHRPIGTIRVFDEGGVCLLHSFAGSHHDGFSYASTRLNMRERVFVDYCRDIIGPSK